MPGTGEELVAIVNGLITNAMRADDLDDLKWNDGTTITQTERLDVRELFFYATSRRKRSDRAAQRRAMTLLRSLLSNAQRASLDHTTSFLVRAPSGATYRLSPRHGYVDHVARHGTRWYAQHAFCLHGSEGPDQIPPADLTIAHLLLLLADEERFLATANATTRNGQLWNRDYLRQLREHREARVGCRCGHWR